MVTKMEHLMTSQRGIRDLEEFQYGPEGRKCPLFHTWNTEQFGEWCHQTHLYNICMIQLLPDSHREKNKVSFKMRFIVSESSSGFLWEAFSQELKLKQAVLQELAHTTDPDLDMVFLSCWLHQPYSPPQTRQTLEALLLETGHRPL